MRRFAAALALVTTAAAAAPARASDSARPLRVVTFNLFHGGPASGLTGDTSDLDTRLAIVIEELRRLAPDVVALQEASERHRIESSEGMDALSGPGGLVDAFRAAHHDALGATVYQRVDAAAPTATRRVDYIFLGGVEQGSHYGVLADLALFGIQCAP